MKKNKYFVATSKFATEAEVIRSFHTKTECRNWLIEGMRACTGTELEHYVKMFLQLLDGRTFLYYRNHR